MSVKTIIACPSSIIMMAFMLVAFVVRVDQQKDIKESGKLSVKEKT